MLDRYCAFLYIYEKFVFLKRLVLLKESKSSYMQKFSNHYSILKRLRQEKGELQLATFNPENDAPFKENIKACSRGEHVYAAFIDLYFQFLKQWKNYVRRKEYKQCEVLCQENIQHVNTQFERLRFPATSGPDATGTLVCSDETSNINPNDNIVNPNMNNYSLSNNQTPRGDLLRELRSFRSRVRNLYAVLLHDHLQRHSDALQQYQLCVLDDPHNASAHYNWAILYKNYFKLCLRLFQAEVHYRKAIELKPKHAAYYNNYGLLLEQQLHNYGEARKKFAAALELDANNGRAHTNMANLLKKYFKEYENANYHYKEAIKLDPQNPTRHFNYGNYDEAGEHYEIAIQLDPLYQQAHAEFKKFLLNESPFSAKRSKTSGGDDVQARQLHGARCMRYLVRLLWGKQIKEAKDLLTMALRCSETNRFANFLRDPSLILFYSLCIFSIYRLSTVEGNDVCLYE
ncbi:TPR Domain containing protein [Reticulomyxa filosa]|uniref:TPR Domain containing protein n=1 Tax=Reticulomyxa filosa TaxID=46433 RepID=X6NQ95_RETFI|nr:TPR Domain containing protein [Reticulomyxa filosa]|eukprot:ETO28196.1 TPR Domain containing protein [Reticulomyxa filosa]